MSSLALMRLLETAPSRYDAGMRVLTLGRVGRLHDAVAEAATPRPGMRVLEIGCGTGAVTARLVARGARVTALDQNPEMIERARLRLASTPPGSVTWMERTASEIDSLPEHAFDAVVASLCFSEMSSSERRFVIREAARCLAQGGVFALADEVKPRGRTQRLLYGLLRAPQAVLGWLVTGSISHPIPNLTEELRACGFRVRSEERWLLGSLAAVIAVVEGGSP
jgi:demethylmenaquinone methyltransferase/2-methoxy-6-polyprenyl-1,4-benzoquinol methylase